MEDVCFVAISIIVHFTTRGMIQIITSYHVAAISQYDPSQQFFGISCFNYKFQYHTTPAFQSVVNDAEFREKLRRLLNEYTPQRAPSEPVDILGVSSVKI